MHQDTTVSFNHKQRENTHRIDLTFPADSEPLELIKALGEIDFAEETRLACGMSCRTP